jgi:hypothetical protein
MKVIAIDLDGTALECVDKVNALFEDKNNFIVIHTARSNSIRSQTEVELAALGLKYHVLKMEKLRADIYIDDKNSGGLNWNI